MNQKLPKPGSKEVESLLKNAKVRAIYTVLFESRNTPLSIGDIRSKIGLGAGEQEHLNRRLRELYGAFNVVRTRNGKDFLYQLKSVSERPHQTSGNISKSVRARVLMDQRCKQCGRTPSEDKVKLHVDHIIPQEWGGTDAEENLQALCAECNEGKKNLYSSYNKFAANIRLAIAFEEPHKRIGELLKAFNGEAIPADLIEVVAKARQYQDDWQKRMRELRELGWKYTVQKKKVGGRVKSSYLLLHSEPWPDGPIQAEIRRREQKKKVS